MNNQEQTVTNEEITIHPKIMKYLKGVLNIPFPIVFNEKVAIFTLRKEVSIGQGLTTGKLNAIVLFSDYAIEEFDMVRNVASKMTPVPEGEVVSDVFYVAVKLSRLDITDFDLTDTFICKVMEGREDEFYKMLASKDFIVEKPIEKPDPVKVNKETNDFIYSCLLMAFNVAFKDPFGASINISQVKHHGQLRVYIEHFKKIGIIYNLAEEHTTESKILVEKEIVGLKDSGIQHGIVINISESFLLRRIQNKDVSYVSDVTHRDLIKLINENKVTYTVVQLTYKDLSKSIIIYLECDREEAKSRIAAWRYGKVTGLTLRGFCSPPTKGEELTIERSIPCEIANEYIVDIVDVIQVKKKL
jgi:hypothetical protein